MPSAQELKQYVVEIDSLEVSFLTLLTAPKHCTWKETSLFYKNLQVIYERYKEQAHAYKEAVLMYQTACRGFDEYGCNTKLAKFETSHMKYSTIVCKLFDALTIRLQNHIAAQSYLETINNITVKSFNDECPLCFESLQMPFEMAASDRRLTFPCRHAYHRSCYEEYLFVKVEKQLTRSTINIDCCLSRHKWTCNAC